MTSSSIIFAKETGGWGVVPSTGWREAPVVSDGFNTRVKPISVQTISSSSGSAATRTLHRQVVEGGGAMFDVPGISNGLGVLFQTAADSATSTLHEDGTLAHDQVFTWGPAGPPAAASVAAEVRRLRKGTSTLDAFTHPGCRCVQLDIGQGIDEALSFKFTMDTKEPILPGSVPSRTITQIDPDILWNWRDATISVNGTAICATSFSLSLPTGIDVEDKCIKQNDNRHEPMRKGRPELTGQLEWDYTNPVYYQAWVAGTVLPLTAEWVGPVAIEGSTFPSLTIDVGAIRFTGEDPQVSVDDPTKQTLPFEIIVDDDDTITITNVTSDSAL